MSTEQAPTQEFPPTAYVFAGQGSQTPGMGATLLSRYPEAADLIAQADRIVGFDLGHLMIEGTTEDLRRTDIAQTSIFLYSVLTHRLGGHPTPSAVAGHSLGEFSALVAAQVLGWEEGLSLVHIRATSMLDACQQAEGTMAAVLGLGDDAVEQACKRARDEGHIVVAANFNSPGQVVISGSVTGIEAATVLLKEAGAKRVVPLSVGGAFHSPLMEPARVRLAKAIESAALSAPVCPVYQNVDGAPQTDVAAIKTRLIEQLTAPVRWTQTIERMSLDGIAHYVEFGPGQVLSGLIKKAYPSSTLNALSMSHADTLVLGV